MIPAYHTIYFHESLREIMESGVILSAEARGEDPGEWWIEGQYRDNPFFAEDWLAGDGGFVFLSIGFPVPHLIGQGDLPYSCHAFLEEKWEAVVFDDRPFLVFDGLHLVREHDAHFRRQDNIATYQREIDKIAREMSVGVLDVIRDPVLRSEIERRLREAADRWTVSPSEGAEEVMRHICKRWDPDKVGAYPRSPGSPPELLVPHSLPVEDAHWLYTPDEGWLPREEWLEG